MRFYSILVLLIISIQVNAQVGVGAEQLDNLMPLLDGKSVGLLVNQTSKVQDRHLIDTLVALDVKVKKIFSPEHGFRGDMDAGSYIKNSVDKITQLPIISLYGSKKKTYSG